MRLFAVLLASLVFLLASPRVFAQGGGLSFERAYSDYVHSMDVYRAERSAYELARLNYLSSKTLSSKSAAESGTLTMLLARDDVVITHLTTLRRGISENSGISDSDKNNYYGEVDPEVTWYKSHKTEVASKTSLDDLVAESQKAKDRYFSVTQLLMYEALGGKELGKVAGFRQRIDRIVGDINSKVGEIRQNGDKNTQKIERWLGEVDTRLKGSDEKKNEARDALGQIKDSFKDKENSFSDFQGLVIDSNQFLKEAGGYLKEIIKEVKTKD